MFPLQGGKPATATTYVDDVFSAYTYTGNGSTQTINNGIALASTATGGTSVGQQAYTTPGTYFWTCPNGVSSVSVVCIGGGGGGDTGNAGGGGGLGYKTSIPVVPGQSYTVVVGAGGAGSVSSGNDGGNSYFISPTIINGGGGVTNTGGPGPGGTFVGDGGGQGGIGYYGGGGAGGYSGTGGSSQAATNGSGGGAGAGYNTFPGAGGGGVGILGAGVSGNTGTAGSTVGVGGSGGASGTAATTAGGAGGAYGGGGGAGNTTTSGGNGAGGAVRIIWGAGRNYPSTLTTDQTTVTNNDATVTQNGGMVWMKARSGAYGPSNHLLTDTVRGNTQLLFSNITSAQAASSTVITAFNSTGFSLGSEVGANASSTDYVSWTFRKAPKFFDVVTYTGNATNRTISHSLGSVPGMIIVKRTDLTADWQVYSNSIANTEYLVLNDTAAKATGTTRWNSTTPTASVFSLGTDTTVNASGGTYVAYLFAHDTAADGLIQCGSFTTDSSSNASVTLGWEPQFLLHKSTTTADNWPIVDSMRGGLTATATVGTGGRVFANLTQAEGGARARINATGFSVDSNTTGGNGVQTYIYLAIRRPNKPPTVGTQVYNSKVWSGSGASQEVPSVGFPTDLAITHMQQVGQIPSWMDRLRGNTRAFNSASTIAEGNWAEGIKNFNYKMTGIMLGTDASGNDGLGAYNYPGYSYVGWFFKRAPGVFDVVCFLGGPTGGTSNIPHGLGVAPELVITKQRSQASSWYVGYNACANHMYLDATTAGLTSNSNNFPSAPTSTNLVLGASIHSGSSTVSLVAYLFATKAGISKVGSYTGNGSSQTINAGFTTGARFILIKRTDSTGDWYVWDSTRGIVAGNDPHLRLNTTAAEVTTNDSIDPDTSGFIVNQLAATNINVNAASYIYLAYA